MSEVVPLEALGGPGGFRRTARYSREADPQSRVATEPEAPANDPISTAYAEGFAAGCATAQAEAEEQARIDAAAREGLSLSIVRLDQDLQEELRLRLRDTVAALCEASIAPLALDEDALVDRIRTAVSMLARADDDRVIRLHPEDIPLISDKMSADWQIVPDPALERGGLRVESVNGGVEDGPAVWRRAIAEALLQC